MYTNASLDVKIAGAALIVESVSHTRLKSIDKEAAKIIKRILVVAKLFVSKAWSEKPAAAPPRRGR